MILLIDIYITHTIVYVIEQLHFIPTIELSNFNDVYSNFKLES